MKLNEIEPFVESLSKGPFFRKILALAMRIAAVLMVFVGLYVVLGMIGTTIMAIRTDAARALGTLMAMVLAIAVFFLVVKILLFRARSILILGDGDYPVLQMSALLLRTSSEVLALIFAGAGLISGIMHWFGGAYFPIPGLWDSFFLPGAPSFVLGLGMILSGLFQAVTVLIVFYLLAELLLLFRNIALNTQR